MKKQTRSAFNAYCQRLAQLNGIDSDDVAAKFTVEPSVAQKLEDRIQQSSGFLSQINLVEVDEQEGQPLGLDIGGTIAGTTDTSAKERQTTDPSDLSGIIYRCEQTNFDTNIPYKKLDMWAKFADFQNRIRSAIVKRQALDRIMIGFNGVKRAATSDRTANPMLQDVNKGWLQKIREHAPDRVMGSLTVNNVTTASPIEVGEKAKYVNLDALVIDGVNELIDEVFQEDPDLVVICGRALLADKYFPIVNKVQPNTEQMAAELIISQKRMGNLPVVRAPYFPANALLITRLNNLSIYWQSGTRRRSVMDNPKRDRIENYESVNESYVLEDLRCAALIENIALQTSRTENEVSVEA